MQFAGFVREFTDPVLPHTFTLTNFGSLAIQNNPINMGVLSFFLCFFTAKTVKTPIIHHSAC